MELTFVDTNVFVYALDPDEGSKHERARHVLRSHFDQLVISTQVLLELASVCHRRMGVPRADVDRIVREAAAIRTVPADRSLVLNATRISVDHDLSIWDAMVVAAAERADCSLLLSEDFTDGQQFGRTVVRNPFA